MMKLMLIVFFLSLPGFPAMGQMQCQEVYQKSLPSLARLNEILDGVEVALEALSQQSFKATKQEVLEFGRADSSFKSLRYFEGDHTSAITRLWALIMKEAFHSRTLENQENLSRAEQLYDQYSEIFKAKPPVAQLMGLAKKNKSSYQGKVGLIEVLKMYSLVVSQALGRDYNLLKQDGLFDLFGVKTRRELEEKVRDNENEYSAFIQRIQEFIVQKSVRNLGHVEQDLVTHFFKDPHARPFTVQDRSFFQRNGSYEEVQALIIQLRLSAAQQEMYLNDLLILKNGHPQNNEGARRQQHRMNALVLMRAAEEVYGQLSFIYNRRLESGFFDYHSYIQLRQLIEGAETARVIVEEKMSDYVDRSDALNARIEEALETLGTIARRHPDRQQEADALRETLNSLEVRDFERNLDRRSQEVFKIEMQIDRVREEIATQRRRESIEDFYDLNNRWQRLIPDKTYNLDGVDYSKVSFTADVISHFSANPLLGARYLAALTKSYVAIKKESGLRRFPSIHPEMRDIKIIRRHGKIRIVGRLVGDTIHFFYVYASEKPYTNRQMEKIVDQFRP